MVKGRCQTLFSSDKHPIRNRRLLKTALSHLGISAFCILIDRVYTLFGHGVSSASMSLMFLYPLVGGTAVFMLLWLYRAAPERMPRYRASYNLYNSGIATLTVGSMLNGVFEIAGTNSPYITVFWAAGWLLAGIGSIGLIIGFIAAGTMRKPEYGRRGWPPKSE